MTSAVIEMYLGSMLSAKTTGLLTVLQNRAATSESRFIVIKQTITKVQIVFIPTMRSKDNRHPI